MLAELTKERPMSGLYEESLRRVECPCCDGCSSVLWMRVPGQPPSSTDFELIRCTSCSHTWISNPPDPEQLSRYYSPEYHQAVEHSGVNDKKRWGRQLNILSLYKAKGDILDIGCSAGGFLTYLKDGPWKLYGIEASADTAEKARAATGGDIFAGDVLKADFAPQSFDVITCSDVLEHLYEPREVFRIVHQWLKPGGIFYVFVPNIMSWEARAFRSRWYGLDPPRHLHHYSILSLKALSSSADLAMVRVVTPEGCYLEQSISLLMNDVLAKAGVTHPNINLSGPAWIGWRVVRKVIRISVEALYSRIASHCGSAPSIQAVFMKPIVPRPQPKNDFNVPLPIQKEVSAVDENHASIGCVAR